MRTGYLVYWLITGALLGLGVVGYPAWDLVAWPISLVLLIIGLFVLRGREQVAGVLGFGFVPEVVLVVLTARKFPPNVPPVYPPVFIAAVLIFGMITVVGLVALVVLWRTSRRASGPLPL
ncbi:MAG: hypothetical protein ACLQUY_14690 [Ktedonobacterales bacterium]